MLILGTLKNLIKLRGGNFNLKINLIYIKTLHFIVILGITLDVHNSQRFQFNAILGIVKNFLSLPENVSHEEEKKLKHSQEMWHDGVLHDNADEMIKWEERYNNLYCKRYEHFLRKGCTDVFFDERESSDVRIDRKRSYPHIKNCNDELPLKIPPSIITATYEKISISKESNILTKALQKKYKCVNNKGIIDSSTSIVYPFGYN